MTVVALLIFGAALLVAAATLVSLPLGLAAAGVAVLGLTWTLLIQETGDE